MFRTGAIKTCAIFALVLFCLCSCRKEKDGGSSAPLACAISLKGQEAGGSSLLCGYNHHLLHRFAASRGRLAEIRLAGNGEAILDSLRNGSLDVVSLPYSDSLAPDSTLVTISVDSCGLWVFCSASADYAGYAGNWLKEFRRSPDYAIERQPYFDLYNPMKRVSADFISPYDSLIRVYADTLGWDWKLLAALMYQESRFHIEARSQAGASGLMQLLPKTARHYGCTDRFDPEQNIRAGVGLLLELRKRYQKIAANPDELTKYTLAAYNAGSGRILDCINHAKHLGADVSRWENVAAVIPQMQDDSVASMSHIKHGKFAGRETVSFVRQVYSYRNRYHHICP